MSPVFQDALLQKEFEKKGYVIIPSLLSGQDIDTLLTLFSAHREEYAGPFHTTHFSTNVDYKKQVHETIVRVVFPKAAAYLNDFRPLFGNLMIKSTGPQNPLPLHADWTYVDEDKYNSVAAWVPLVDVDEKNGCMGIVEGSHLITNRIRGPWIKQTTSLKHDKKWEKRYGRLIPMKAGDAIIYSHAFLHYSLDNTTETVRPALNLSMAPAEAEIVHYCIPEGKGNIEIYRVPDPDFFIHYNNFQRPETGTMIGTLPRDSVKYIDDKLDAYWRKTGLFNSMGRWFRNLNR